MAAPFPMTDFGSGLMQASPQRPSQDVLDPQAGALLQTADETSDFILAEIDQRSGSGCPFLPLVATAAAAALSLMRITARKASASMARVTCRYQPCRERIS